MGGWEEGLEQFNQRQIEFGRCIPSPLRRDDPEEGLATLQGSKKGCTQEPTLAPVHASLAESRYLLGKTQLSMLLRSVF